MNKDTNGSPDVEPDIDLSRHLQRILEAIEELTALSKAFAAPAPESIQFLGTVVDNTVALLTAPANSIDRGGRHVSFDQKRNWLSLMQAVHRSFFSSIHLATEAGLAQICSQYRIEVTASSRLKAKRIVCRLKGKIDNRDAKEILGLAGKLPQFDDFLNAVVGKADLEQSIAVTWRRYFRALSIIRNKVSHSNATLSAGEVSDLQAGGFSAAVSDGQLGVNPRMYRQIVEQIAGFFTLILAKLPPLTKCAL
jgi:hypothetical protein